MVRRSAVLSRIPRTSRPSSVRGRSLSISALAWASSLASAEGDLTLLRIVRDLQAELSFSEAEHKEFEFRHEGTAVLGIDAVDNDGAALTAVAVAELKGDLVVLEISELE